MRLLWLDLETTGLDPQRDAILEVAATTADLKSPFDIGYAFESVLRFDRARESHTIDVHHVVAEMHTKNGLWDACLRSATTVQDAETHLLSMIPHVGSDDRENQTTLAGSCVSFDLAFIRRWMPQLAKLLHYRVYDVSSMALFCRSLGMPRPPKVEAHRAMADVRESIRLAERCADWLGRYPAPRHGEEK